MKQRPQGSGVSWLFDGSLQRKKWVTWFIIGVTVVFVITIFVGYGVNIFTRPAPGAPPGRSSDAGRPKTPQGGETKPILSAGLFEGRAAAAYRPRAAEAYRAAGQIPDILDKLYCYCECELHGGHKSLKSCFTDDHGANCDICIEEALLAKELHDRGLSADEIKAAVDRAFAQYGA